MSIDRLAATAADARRIWVVDDDRSVRFVLATEAGQDEMTVCLDEAFEGFNTDSGEALFDAEGGETPYLQQLKRFMLGYHQDMVRTTQFAARLLELDLLTEQTIDAQLNGQTSSLKGFKVVDEARLRALPPEAFAAKVRAAGMSALGGMLANKSTRFLSPFITSINARRFSTSVPRTCDGSGKPQCAVAGLPGQIGHTSPAALSQTVTMKSILGALGKPNSSQLLLRNLDWS